MHYFQWPLDKHKKRNSSGYENTRLHSCIDSHASKIACMMHNKPYSVE